MFTRRVWFLCAPYEAACDAVNLAFSPLLDEWMYETVIELLSRKENLLRFSCATQFVGQIISRSLDCLHYVFFRLPSAWKRKFLPWVASSEHVDRKSEKREKRASRESWISANFHPGFATFVWSGGRRSQLIVELCVPRVNVANKS